MITAYGLAAIPLQGKLAMVDLLGPVAWFAVAAVGVTLAVLTVLAARDHADRRHHIPRGTQRPAEPRFAA